MTNKQFLKLCIRKVNLLGLLIIGVLAFLSQQMISAQALAPQAYKEGVLSIGLVADDSGGTTWAVMSCEKTVSGEFVIPATYNGRKITTIYDQAFADCTGLTKVVIPEGITTIKASAFSNCTELTDITIASSVDSIEFRAFAGCTELKSVTLPQSVTTLGKEVFYDCSNLTDIALSDNLGVIPQYAFANCASLKSIRIPEGVTQIGSGAFLNCSALTEVTIPNSITQMDNSIFSGCANLAYNRYDNAKYLGNTTNPYFMLVESVSKDITQCQIHPDTKFVCFRAFADHTNLTAIAIPDSVISIGYAAFNNCPSMTDFTIGKGLQYFEPISFNGFPKLQGIQVAEENPYYSNDSFGVLFNKDKTILHCAPETLSGSYEIADSVTTISSGAFRNCDNLTGITIGKNITEIGSGAFVSCDNLNLQIAEGNTNYKLDGVGALYTADNTTLLYVPASVHGYTVPEGVTTISSTVFNDCTGLENIIIPDTVTTLATFFEGCSNLKTIYFSGTKENWQTLIYYTFGERWPETINVIFEATITTVPATAPAETVTIAPTETSAENPSVSTAERQNNGNHTGWILGAVAGITICTVVVILVKKKKT